MKGVAENGEGDMPFLQKFHQFPEIRVEDRVTAGNIEIGEPSEGPAEFFHIIYHLLHSFPGHAVQLLAGIFCKNIAMLAALVTGFCDMPLKGEILTHESFLLFPYTTYRLFRCAAGRTGLFVRFCRTTGTSAGGSRLFFRFCCAAGRARFFFRLCSTTGASAGGSRLLLRLSCTAGAATVKCCLFIHHFAPSK